MEKRFLVWLIVVVISLLSRSGSNMASSQEEIPVDYIIVLDTSATMYSNVLLITTDFFECEPEYIDNKGKTRNLYRDAIANSEITDDKFYAKRISIARGTLECFLTKYGKDHDRIALFFIDSNGIESATDGFWCYSEWSSILELIKGKEDKISGSAYYSPLGDALWEAVNLFHYEGRDDTRYVMLFISDLIETPPPEGGMLLCDTAKEIFRVYGEEIRIESVFFLCIASKRQDYEEKLECFSKYLPSVTMIPVSMEGGFSFSTIERIMYLQDKTRSLKRELDDKKGDIMVLEDRINECEESKDTPSNINAILATLRLPLFFILTVSGVGIMWGLKILFSSRNS